MRNALSAAACWLCSVLFAAAELFTAFTRPLWPQFDRTWIHATGAGIALLAATVGALVWLQFPERRWYVVGAVCAGQAYVLVTIFHYL